MIKNLMKHAKIVKLGQLFFIAISLPLTTEKYIAQTNPNYESRKHYTTRIKIKLLRLSNFEMLIY